MIRVKENDLRPYAFTIAKKGGQVFPLTGATGVTFRMRHRDEDPSNTPKVEAAGTFPDAAAGEMQYQWVAGDTDTPGTYFAEWTVDWSGEDETFPTHFADVVLVEARVAT
jgi:hypothetical protein